MRSSKGMILTPETIGHHRSWLVGQGCSPHTARAYCSDLMLFTTDSPQAVGLDIGTAELEAQAVIWLNEGRTVWKAKTTQRRRTALRSFAKYGGNDDFLRHYRTPSAAPGYAHPVAGGVEAVQAMVDAALSVEHQALIALCGLAGLRVAEACAVTVPDVNLSLQMLLVHGKGAKDRSVPISPRALPYVAFAYGRALAAGRDRLVPLADRTARQVITTVARRAGLGHVASHDLRMTFGTAAYEKTRDLRAVQELLGHSDSKTTELYTGISTGAMREAADL